jgi:hypothetical protein
MDRSKIDVLMELEAEAEEDSLFENPGRDLGVADGAGRMASLFRNSSRVRSGTSSPDFR